MKRAAAIALLLLAAAPAARADGSVLVTTAASTIGTQVAADLVRTPRGGLGVFATRWESEGHGTLTGYGARAAWDLYRELALEIRASWLESKEDDWETTLLPLEAALTWRFRLMEKFMPYIGGGLGYYWLDAEARDPEAEDLSDEYAGYFALAGLNLALGPVTLFAEAKYNLVGPGKDLDWRGSDLGAENALDGLSASAGLKLGF